MAKPKIPNQKKKYQELNNRLNRYVALVEQIYNTLNLEAAKIALNTEYDADSDTVFKFSDYPQTNKAIADIQAQFVDDIRSVVYRGTSEEWKNSNELQDLMADKILKAYTATIDKKKYKVLYQTNSDALKAFQNRKDRGFNVSAKLWQQSTIYKEGLEAAISCAIQKGISAVTLSKQISKYLLDFPSLQKDYKEKYGNAEHLKDCEYRSIRLARSEINMAYRAAENERWKQMDFVVGYEIKLSGRHPAHDVCDDLAGKYPKDFVWTGWHPNDLCYKIPILKTEEEFWQWDGRSETTTESVNEVKDVPDSFKKWVLSNQQRIDAAKKLETLPYFLKDNKDVVAEIFAENNKREGQDRLTQSESGELHQGTVPYSVFSRITSFPSYSNEEFEYFIKEIGYDKKPEVVSSVSFDELKESNEYISIQRGVSGEYAQQAEHSLKYGEYSLGHGRSSYGKGIYFSDGTSGVARKKSTDGVIIDALLPKDAKIVDYYEIEKEAKAAFLETTKESFADTPAYRITQSETMYAAKKGYDAVFVSDEGYYIILNRAKLIVRE